MKKRILAAAAAVGVLVATAAVYIGQGRPAQTFVDPSDQSLVLRGKDIYANQCAACHGARLEGQPDWRQRRANGRLPAPPHDVSGHTWHHPDSVLIDIVKHGLMPGKTAPEGYESDMPAYGKLLGDAEIVAVLAYIKSAWSAEALEAQKAVTLQDQRKTRQ